MGNERLKSSGFQLCLALLCLAINSFACGQVLNQDQEIQVRDLPNLMARSHDPSEVLLTSLDTVFHDRAVCCGRDSALEDSAAAADPKSLKDVAGKLDGRHLLSDGRPIMVKAEYAAPEATNASNLISAIIHQHAALMAWNSHLYMVHGVVYMWMATGSPDSGVSEGAVIHKILLWDTRYSDSRRQVVFNRDTDDVKAIQGFLFLQVAPQ